MSIADARGSPVAVWLTAAACAFIATIVLYPGQYPYDAANQFWQARTGHLGDGSPVTMAALWSLLLRLTGYPAALFLLNVVLFWAGLALCAAAVDAPRLLRVALVIVVGLSPLALVQMGHVLTDAHLAAAMVLVTGLAAWGLTAGKRTALVACAAVLIYAGCIRMNAITATAPFAFALAGFAKARTGRRTLLTGLAAASCIAVCTATLAFALDRTLVKRPISAWPTLVLWDLAAISVARNTLLLPAFTHGHGLTVDELERTKAFDEAVNVPLFQVAGLAGWIRRDRATGVLALSVAASTLVYAAACVLVAPAADLRYLTWPIVAAPLALAFALCRSPKT